jgi:hypothetical protein
MREKKNVYRLLVGKPERKMPLGRARHRWIDNFRMDLSETVWDRMDWIGLALIRDKRRADVKAVMSLRVQ